MTRCDFSFETFSAYVDGQLRPEQELEVRRHLDGCSRCRDAVENLLQMNEAIASASEVHPVPHAVRERVNQLASSKPERPSGFQWRTLAVAAVLLVAIAVGLWVGASKTSAVDQLSRALIEDHVRYLKIPDAIQVASNDPQRIAESFHDRVGFPIELPRLSDASLLGGRFCWLHGHKALLSFYDRNGQRFSLFVLSEKALPVAALPKAQCTSSGEYEVCLLRAAPELLAMVGDREQAQALLPQLQRFGEQQGRR
jgi:anti-sigma factor RsiW